MNDLVERIQESQERVVKTRKLIDEAKRERRQSDLDILKSRKLIERSREIVRRCSSLAKARKEVA